jgi:hypothetical protein
MTLEEKAELYADRIAEWELFMVALICKEIGRIGKMTPEQAKKYDAEKETKKTEKIITSALTTSVLLNIKDLPNTYTDVFDEIHKESQYMYKYKGVPFVDIAEDKTAQKIINQYTKKNGADLLEFAKTKAVKVLDADGNPVALRKQILKSFQDASDYVSSGKTDFYSAMRKSVLELGGNGARVEYPNGMTRRLDTVVRQNMLYNMKMASADYNRHIGEELGCDGIEISFSANPRPSHRFMEGKQYAKKHGKTVNGVYYEGAEDKGVYARLYEDYNCNHREKQIILGVSEPTYSAEELARLKAENEKQFTIGNSTGDGYFWSQRMRSLESATRKAKGQINSLEALGDAESKAKAKELRKRVKVYRQKYDEICNTTGMKPDLNRMSVPRLTKK